MCVFVCARAHSGEIERERGERERARVRVCLIACGSVFSASPCASVCLRVCVCLRVFVWGVCVHGYIFEHIHIYTETKRKKEVQSHLKVCPKHAQVPTYIYYAYHGHTRS